MRASAGFDLQSVDHENVTVLMVSGYMGNAEYAALRGRLEQLFQEGRRQAVLDFTELTFVTTASLARLSKLARKFEADGGSVLLCGLPARVTDLLGLSGLDRCFAAVVDVAAASQYFLTQAKPGRPARVPVSLQRAVPSYRPPTSRPTRRAAVSRRG